MNDQNSNKYLIISFLLCIFPLISKAEKADSTWKKIAHAELRLKTYFDDIADTRDDQLKLNLNDSIIKTFDTLLMLDESFQYPFDSLKFVGKIASPDNKFRIINWNLEFRNGTYQYYGYIQVYDKKNKELELFSLTDRSDSIKNPTQQTLNHENWYGALYYRIIENKYRKTSFYTLLAWDGNDDFTNKKIIEILYFTRSGKPKFGKPVFDINNERMKRVIFEFNNRAVLTLRYDEHLDMIVYEHLSPEKPSQTGKFQFYVPDFSYDGLEFKKGKYIYHPAIDVYNQKPVNKKKLEELKRRKKSFSF